MDKSFQQVKRLMAAIVIYYCSGILWAADEWPMFKSDAAHSSIAPADTLLPPFVMKWNSSTVLGSNNAVAYSSPIMLNGKTYIGAVDGTLYAFNGNVGSQANAPIWKYKTDGLIYGSPAVATIGSQDYVFIGATDGNLYGFKASDGTLVCKQALGGPVFTSPLVVTEGSNIVVLCAAHSGILSAFNVTTPTSTTSYWSAPATLTNNLLFASPAYDSTNDLVFEPSYDGNLYALYVSGAQAGQVAWTAAVGPTRSTPAVTVNYLYNFSNNGTLTCLMKNNGSAKATMTISGTNVAASPAAYSNGTIDTIITAGLNGMVQKWQFTGSGGFNSQWGQVLPNGVYSSPAVSTASNVLFVGCNDKNLYSLNLTNGNITSTTPMGKTVQISPAVAEGMLLVSSSGGNFEAFMDPTFTFTPTYTPTNTFTPTITFTPTNTPVPCGIAFDSVTSTNVTATSFTLSHTVSGNNTLLVVQALVQASASTDRFNSMTFDGTAMTQAAIDQDTLNHVILSTWYLVNPPVGTYNIVGSITDSTAQIMHIGAISYTGVNQSTPIGATTSKNQGVASHPSITLITTKSNSWIATSIACLASGFTITDGNGQNQRWSITANDPTEGDDLSTTSAGSYSPSYTLSGSAKSDMLAVEIEPFVCNTNTPTNSPTKTPTNTPTNTPTQTPTNTPTVIPTNTFTPATLSIYWGQATGAAEFSARSGHACVYYNNLLWLIGGTDANGPKNDVWYSPDGTNWQLATASAGFSPRSGHQALVYNGLMWVLGGFNGTTYKNDVWYSSDGTTWTQATGGTFFGARANFGAVVYNGSMWVIGGNASGNLSDVWNSTTGNNWSNPTVTQGFGSLSSFGCVVFNNQMWILGGNVGLGPSGNIFSSTNGTSWNSQTPTGFPALMNESTVVYNDQIFTVAGTINNGGNFSSTSNVYASSDGIHWNLSNGNPGFTARNGQSLVVGFNAMWMAGGTDNSNSNYRNDVWYSPFNATATYTPSSPTFTFTPTPTPTTGCPIQATWTASDPVGLAVDSANNIYVTDDDANNIDVFNSQGLLRQFGVQGPQNGQLDSPEGIAVDGQGNIYVADSGNNRIQIFDNSGHYLKQWGVEGVGPGQFEYPVGILLAPATIYVVDSDNARIQALDYQGNYLFQWGGPGTGGNGTFSTPWGIATDSSGQIYVTDNDTSIVQVFNGQGQWQRQWNVTTGGNLAGAAAICIPSNGPVYVSDGAGAVGIFDSIGNPLAFTTGGNPAFNDPEGIAVAGNTWFVADAGNGLVEQFGNCPGVYWTPTPTPTPVPTVFCFTLNIGQGQPGGNANGQFQSMSGVAVDLANNHVYASDPGNSRIQQFSLTGVFQNAWGTPGNLNLQFNNPQDLAVDANGNLYVADMGNNRIQILSSTGAFVAVMGGPNSGNANGQFNAPSGVALDGLGNIYVVDSGNLRIQKFNPARAYQNQWNFTTNPISNHVVVDQAGYVYVTDGATHLIKKYDSSGSLQAEWGSYGSGQGQFLGLNGLAVGPCGLIYVTDAGNSRITFFDPIGNYKGQQTMTVPYQPAFDGAGNLYVSSPSLLTVSKYAPCGLSCPSPTFTNTPTPTWTPQVMPWAKVTGSAPFSARGSHASLYYNGQGWVIGGQDNSGARNDVWYSLDGVNWKLTTSNATFSARYGHQALVYQNKMWILGGQDSNGYKNDVWSSSDGLNWTQATPTLPFTARAYAGALVYDGKMWIIGGSSTSGILTDAWYSTDGATWTQANTNLPLISYFGCAVFNNRMWIFGGNPPSGTSDVWSSTDGANWTAARNTMAFAGIPILQVVTLNNQLVAIGNGGGIEDISISTDGINWTLEDTALGPTGRNYSACLATGSQIWVIGGIAGSSNYLNDVWVSPPPSTTPTATPTPAYTLGICSSGQPGNNWNLVPAVGGPMSDSGGVVFDPLDGQGPRMWIFRQTSGGTEAIYSSLDGITWQPVNTNAAFGSRGNEGLMVYNGQMWVIGGVSSAGLLLNDTWSSPDGVHWNRVTATAGFSPRMGLGTASFNGKMWVIGGRTSLGPGVTSNDVWYSADGAHWYSATNSAGFQSREFHSTAVFNNQLWIMAGDNYGPAPNYTNTLLNDVWSSVDGVNWVQATSAANFTPRTLQLTTVLGNVLWLMGGYTSGNVASSDVWVSQDGVNWSNSTAPFSGSGAGALTYNNSVWFVGGNGTNWVWNSPGCLMLTPTPIGTPTPAYSCGQGIASISGFNQPAGLAVNSTATTIYVADAGNHALKVFPSGAMTPVASVSSWTGGPGAFQYAIDVAVDHLGNIFVADYTNGYVNEFNGSLNYVNSYVAGAVGNIRGIWVDDLWGNNSIYLTSQNGSAYRYDWNGATYVQAKVFGSGILSVPTGIVKSGNWIYVADNSGKIYGFDSSNNYTSTIMYSGLNNPQDLRMDFAGNFYVGESSAAQVDMLGLNTQTNQFYLRNSYVVPAPWGAVVDANLRVFATEMQGTAVAVIQGCMQGHPATSTPTGTLTPTMTPTPLVVSPSWYVNCGGPQVSFNQYFSWAADENYYCSSACDTHTTNAFITGAGGTGNQELYQDARYSDNLSYGFNVPTGRYQVTLKFAEINVNLGFPGPGDRVFSVAINNAVVLPDFDILSDVGNQNTADDKIFNDITPNSNGQIVIQFQKTKSGGYPAQINAIQILPMGTLTNTVRVVAGGTGFNDSQGNQWTNDLGGIYYGTNLLTNSTISSINGALPASTDQALYQSERTGNPLNYALDVPNGNYQVRLKFAEFDYSSTGQRQFNIALNGTTVISNFDIVGDAGAEYVADDKVFDNITPNSSGQINLQLSKALFNGGDAKIDAIQILPEPTPQMVWRVACGKSSAYTDNTLQHNIWSADGNYGGNNPFMNTTTNSIAGTIDPALYQSDRVGTPLNYAFNVPPGNYQVTLKFAEIYNGVTGSGQRVFNVSLNGATVLSNFDIFADVGASYQVDDKVFDGVTPNSNGQIVIQLSKITGNPKINAIQIIPEPTPQSTWRVACGKITSYTDNSPQHNVWSVDGNYYGDHLYNNATVANITGTSDPTLYQSTRWGTGGVTYAFPVPAGSYKVTLKFAETVYTAAGQHVLNAAINNMAVLSNFDIYADAGGQNKADDKVFYAVSPNADGQIVIQLSSVVAPPSINAIEIVPYCCQPVATVSGLSQPAGVAVDYSKNHILVADVANHALKVYDANSYSLLKSITAWGANSSFAYIIDVAADSQGNIYAADYSNGAVYEFDPNYNYVTTIGSGYVGNARGLWVDIQGTTTSVYVTSQNGNVYRYDNVAGAGFPAAPNATYVDGPSTVPTGVVKSGNLLYVANNDGHVMSFDTTLNNPPAVPVLSNMGSLYGLRTDLAGNFYLTNANSGTVCRYDPTFTTLQNTCYASTPWEAVVAANGTMFVAEDMVTGDLKAFQGCVTQPTLTPTFTPTPGGPGRVMPLTGSESEGSTATPTSTPTPTITPTSTPTPSFAGLAAAAPNISRNGQPIQFLVNLDKPSQIRLSLFSIMGEGVYQITVQGNMGLNSIPWNLQNQGGSPVASGLYLYELEAIDGASKKTQTGKVAVFH